ncbi:MAG: type VI secretion system baseplate subunit TssG [Paracoccus sp. (in: a-proteobacteria)]|uniref:type VI secretion system baseplate subunit TssG n=1 Tax=Paracoccus sp. TaxID=267 RepID=UPI0026E01CF8|nr:type VI secretion system baseplate subunit TssG [Paracoccus sp. (in: a-proteobacteria)]MDO5622921.1 type VI secretion system baseplate subunit TssG [Paracoccus sp. (in: a-proteobacteria)]
MSAGFLSLLRRLEREGADRPRIGRSARLADDLVEIGQDPLLAFPASDLGDADLGQRRARIRAQFMGYFGPHGALPLDTTEEVLRWQQAGEDAFVRFADIFAGRFYQLFFRAWSDAHAISQHDRPDEDRFAGYVAAISGVGTPAFADHDRMPDIARLPLVSIFGGRVRSGVRLRQMLARYFSLSVEIEEHVPMWLEFETEDRCGLGQGGSLGQNVYLGARLQSVSEKICIHLHLPDAASYRSFLPGQDRYQQLADLVFWYLGRSYDVDLALTLPRPQVPPAQLGQTVSLGWLAALKPDPDPAGAPYVEIARFALTPDTDLKEAA